MDVNHLKKIDDVLSEMTENGFVAGANCLVLKDGEEVYYGEKGYADISGGLPLKRDSIFRLYSMSKPVTSAAVMLLVQDGLLDLNNPVGDYIPTFKNQVVADRYDRVPVRRAMKVIDLLNMRGGLTYGGDLNTPEAMTLKITEEAISRLDTDHEMSTLEFAKRLGEVPLLFNPGEHFQYSFSADVLGAIIEVVSGMSFGEFLSKRIFKPLGMEDTGFFVPSDRQSRLVKVYKGTESGLKEFNFNHLAINLKMDHEPAFQSGGAGLVTTIDDYAKFATMLNNNGELNGVRVMEPGTVRYMTTGHMEEAPRKDFMTWDGVDGFIYSNLLRILKDEGAAVTCGVEGEYGWDGWLGPYFTNDPKHKVTILHMIQKTDSGTTTYTRRIRNIVYSSLEA